MRSDESEGGGAGDAAAPLGGERDPTVQQVIEQFAEMHVSMLSEVAAIEEAHRRLLGDARARLEDRLGADHPRVRSLGTAAEKSTALAEALSAVVGDRSGRRGGPEKSSEGRRPPKRKEPPAPGTQTRSTSGGKKPGPRLTTGPG